MTPPLIARRSAGANHCLPLRTSAVLPIVLALLSTAEGLRGDVFDMGPGLTSLESVRIGHAGNIADTEVMSDGTTGYGSVPYAFRMGKYEITTGQYTEFLNSVAADDTYGLYDLSMSSGLRPFGIERHETPGSYTYSVPMEWANRPIGFISWGDAARFCNWLHNGQPVGPQGLATTEDGSYFVNGATHPVIVVGIAREDDATWVIPNEHEWYKAAYHDNTGTTGSYFDYPTSSDTVPTPFILDPDPGNSAHYRDELGPPYWRTEVGFFENSASPYGTFDQGGNVSEWLEATWQTEPWNPDLRRARGGDFFVCMGGTNPAADLHASDRTYGFEANYALDNLGFRVALVPEPSAFALLGIGGVCLIACAYRRRKR